MELETLVYCFLVLFLKCFSVSVAQNPFFNLVSSIYQWTSPANERLVADTTTFFDKYDFIVIGAGSGGCVVSNRLTENPEWKVLLLEAGRDEMFITDVPLSATVLGQTSYNWGYTAEKMRTACLGMTNGRCTVAKGRGMGGTSIVNLMVHVRGHQKDFDKWGLQNPGWDYDSILPYFIKSETSTGIFPSDDLYHGTNGPLSVQYSKFTTPLLQKFFESSKLFEYNITDNNGKSQLGFARVQANLRNGRRCSASKAYIRPIRDRPNLFVAKEARVTKILIDPASKKAFGVEFVKNRVRRRIRVKKEVILSAGAINSPQLLMISGIGPEKHLRDLKINLIKDLPVGYNLQDHISFNGLTFLLNDTVTLSDNRVENLQDFYDYMMNNRGPYTVPGGTEGIAFLKSKYTENKYDDYPDIELVLGTGAYNGDRRGSIRKLLGIPETFYETVYRDVKDVPGFSIVPVLLNTKSKGRVMLKSKSPFQWPLIYANFFGNDEDVKILIDGVKMAIAVGESEPFKAFNATLHKVPYPGCEHLEWGTDPYWECCARRYSNSLFHQSGTCKMGPASDPNSVVDPELKVHGIQGLRVVDASIMPELIAGHPNAAVYMIGEKASDMIKETWKSR